MPSELSIRAVHQGGMSFVAGNESHAVTMDYPLAAGDACAGLRPLELLLSSLAGCSGSTVGLLLGKMQQPLQGLEVIAHALRREEHPTVLTEIDLEFVVRGEDVDPAAVQRALTVAESQLCPVWAMLKDGTPIRTSFRIEAG